MRKLGKERPPQAAGVTSQSRRRMLKTLTATMATGVAVALYGHNAEGNDLVVERTTIHIAEWPSDLPSVRIGFLSDLHCDCEQALTRAKRSVQMLLKEEPEIVLLGGDYVTHDGAAWAPKIVDALQPLTVAKWGAHAVFGNHDWWSGGVAVLSHHFRAVGIQMLQNTAFPLPIDNTGRIWIASQDDVLNAKENETQSLMGVPPEALKILLVHEPDLADYLWGKYILQLSGHSHAGQVRLLGHPILCPIMGKKYPQGLQQAKNHLVYTSRGVGMVGAQMRIDCPPEVTVLTVGR